MLFAITFYFGIAIAFALYVYVGWSGLSSLVLGFVLAFMVSIVAIFFSPTIRDGDNIPSLRML